VLAVLEELELELELEPELELELELELEPELVLVAPSSLSSPSYATSNNAALPVSMCRRPMPTRDPL
jgi:hypothetical protein